ncbi:competence type IV pilus minor pilin ComGD [Peribacillus glennii]|uniref:competence type IV pilus minor pilin ComGD n=1 Tax=Peribacillus glennii TaxID=2303991 RepID=UPI00115E88A7|nr:competence type IV pilus minor pilin ComGD [Peribacillus glennii]
MIVLTIFILVISLASGLFPHFMKNQNTELFLRHLSDDIYYAQSYAISHQQYIEVYIIVSAKGTGGQYYIRNVSKGVLLERDIPGDIKFLEGTMELRLFFASNGNITKSGVWKVKTANGDYKITFNIGKGRFRIEKL